MKHLLIFDLDGTLIDSKGDLAASVNHVRASFDVGPLPVEEITGYLGEGVDTLLRRSLPAPISRYLDLARSRFFDYYGRHLLEQTRLFPGVRETLGALDCHALAVLSNKPAGFSQAVIDGLGLGHAFVVVYGGDSFEQKKPHPMGILRLMAEVQVDASRTAIIGDSAVDVRAGREAAVRTFGVRYGYASSSFKEVPPDVLLESLEALVDWFPCR